MIITTAPPPWRFIWGTQAIPHLIPDKLLEVSDVADYLGGKYGGWYDMPKQYGTHQGKWISLPLCVGGNYINYRKSMAKEVGFDKFPTTTDDFMKLAKELKKAGKPGGFALGHATGDANAWTHWLIWTFGGSLVDEKWLLDLERRHFVELAKTPKTQERIEHMLKAGKPLRN